MWMGIDGGGSSLRVVIVDDDLQTRAHVEGDTANPNVIGREAAQNRIQDYMRQALDQAGQVAGVGIGIAGASDEHAADWLRAVVNPVLPDAALVTSSDVEIALVGARAQADGVLLLAGTGSVALGIHPDGRRQQVGGWGYLLGDEGGGYWIGTQALHALTLWADGRLSESSDLPNALMNHLNLATPRQVIGWRYQQASTADVAALAPLVLDLAQTDALARHIITRAADHLSETVRHVLACLGMQPDAIAFAGSLLTTPNPLSAQVCATLGLSDAPTPRYVPAIGAALLAKLRTR